MLTKYIDTMTKDDFWHQEIRLDGLFDDLFGRANKQLSQQQYRTRETDKEMVIELDVPGVHPEDIDVSADNQRLVVSYAQRGKKQNREVRHPIRL